jgi:hypothetical protein
MSQRQPWATKNTNSYDTVFNQCQCDNVLTATKETLCAIDGIQCPESPARIPSASIDPVQDLIGLQSRSRLSHEVDDAIRQVGCVPQCRRILFRDQRVRRTVTTQSRSDKRLHAEISNGHRRRIAFCQRTSRHVLFDHTGEVNSLCDRSHRQQGFGTELVVCAVLSNHGLRCLRADPNRVSLQALME